jgi:quinol monooxygenase YgiN
MRHLLWLVLASSPLFLGLAAAGPASAQGGQGTVHVVTYVELQAASTKNGVALLKQYRDGARKEAGNVEAEIGQEIGRPNRFVLIEGWRDQSAFDAHEKAGAIGRIREALMAIQHNPPDQRVNIGFDVAPSAGQGAFIAETHIDVIPPRQAATESALKAEAAATRKDSGNVRWDVFQQLAPRTNHFNVLAVWRSQRDFDRHEAAAHRAQFRDTLAPLLGALYDERLYRLM